MSRIVPGNETISIFIQNTQTHSPKTMPTTSTILYGIEKPKSNGFEQWKELEHFLWDFILFCVCFFGYRMYSNYFSILEFELDRIPLAHRITLIPKILFKISFGKALDKHRTNITFSFDR